MTLAVLDTTVPGHVGGDVAADQAGWLDELAGSTTDPVLVFAPPPGVEPRSRTTASRPSGLARLHDVFTRRENIVGYFAGHTHTNHVVR